jgi:transposase
MWMFAGIIAVSGQTRRQVVDIPLIQPEYIEHRSCQKVCPGCGRVNTGIYPEGVNAPIQYGTKVKSTVKLYVGISAFAL